MPDPTEAQRPTAAESPRAPRWPWLIFLLINGIILGAFFWPAIVGRSMLVPLDIAPNLFPKFHYADPSATGVPANHYSVDLMLGDVSRNLLVHEAWRRGEMPWWDPYTDGGKPLAAEANAVNISDPFKVLLFHALPFEPAYTWVRIAPFLICGLGAFFLLRQFGFGFAVSLWGGLLYEFAGCNVVMFSGPTVQASFAYYPWLWVTWHGAIYRRSFGLFAGSSLLTALIFLSGNLQSHSYVFLFALAFVAGYGWRRPERWRLLLAGASVALLLGLCLSAPFVLPQVELYLLSARKIQPTASPISFLSGVASCAALFPWALGTFRTLDLSKLFGQPELGFWIYIGSAALVIALIGAKGRSEPGTADRDLKRTALALCVLYFLISSTPLVRVFYLRTAWLAVLGLVLLFARGWTFLSRRPGPWRAWAGGTLIAAGLLAVALNVGGWVLYPKYQAKIEARFVEAQRGNPSLDSAEALRRFQVRNFPHEVTLQNPETLLALLGLVALGLFLRKPPVARSLALNGILMLSTLPLLAYGHRFIPSQPITLWKSIRGGGPEQQRVAAALQPRNLRLLETGPGSHEFLFPGAMSQLFKLHVLHGHTSLALSNVNFIPTATGKVPDQFFDFEYHSATRGLERGELLPSTATTCSRFHWSDGSPRKIEVKEETLTRLALSLEPRDAGILIRTDAFYPGWRAFSGPEELKVEFEPPCFSRVQIPARAMEVRFIYEPRPWRLGLGLAVGGLAALAILLAATHRRGAMA